MTIEVPLTRGKVALIDDEDAELVLRYKWQAELNHAGIWYASHGYRIGPRRENRHGRISMHGLIMEPPAGLEVDHIDRDGLNNRRSNLRISTAQNMANRRLLRSNDTSGYQGLSFIRSTGKWLAYVNADGARRSVGWFTDPREAAMARDAAARELLGEFAVLNFPD